MKKLFSFFLALLATTALWAYDFQSGDLYYTSTSSSEPYTVEVSEAELSITTATIPETVTYNGITYSVTSIGNEAFSYCSSLTSITIPNSVTSIGYKAFSDCYSLTSVTIPESITSIGHRAFQYCSSLTSVTIPNSVTNIGDEAFSGCSGLTSIIVKGGNTIYDSRENCNAIVETATNTLIVGCQSTNIPYSVTNIGGGAFSYCSSLTSVTIPNSVTSIGENAFYYCSSLTSINIPTNVTSIGYRTFSYCSSLTSITIPNNVTSIGYDAFSYCSSLTSITIPNSVTSIGYDAFSYCSSLTSITIPNSVTSIGYEAFSYCSSLTSITIPNSVTSIENYAFEGCSGLTSIIVKGGNTIYDSRENCNAIVETATNTLIVGCQSTIIPYSVTSIGNGAFSGCSSLTSVTIPESITSIGHSAFKYCSSLTSVTIPNSVTSIGNYAFSGCSALTYPVYNANCFVYMPTSFEGDYTIPYGIYQIVGGAFDSCKSLTSITIPNSVTSVGDYAFSGCSLASVTINSDVIMNQHDYLHDIFGSQVKEYVIGDSITEIRNNTFQNFYSLESVTIGKNVTSIGENAFEGCSALDSIVWNAKNYINFSKKENAPFYDCRSQIKSFTFGEAVEHIPAYLCYGMEKLTNIVLFNKTKTIGTSTFEGCIRLGKVTLGSSIQNIAAKAFAGCTRLYDVYCYATYPPFADATSFANYNAYLYVPCENQRDYTLDMVWGNFKFIECITSEDVSTDGVVITPTTNDVTIIWPTEIGADTYTIVIKKGNEVFCTLTFNADGQLLNIAFAPGRDGNHPAQYAEQAGNGYRFTVTGLEEGTHYAYNIDVRDAANKTIKSHTGEFTTESMTAVENITTNNANIQKIIRNGQLLILRDGVEYTIMGQKL